MPFSRRSCNGRRSADSVQDGFGTRRFYIRALRSQTRSIILLLALMEALKHGPMKMVYAGRQGFPEPGEQDYGITYTVAYVLSYVYLCVFMVFFIPLFSWWLPDTPSDPSHPSTLAKMTRWIEKFNMIWLPFCVAISVFFYLLILAEAFIYVDSRRSESTGVSKNSKRMWRIRGLLLMCIATSVSFGYAAIQILEMMELARIKPLEYALIIIPVQINIGMMIGTKMQRRMKKRAAREGADQEQQTQGQVQLDGVTIDVVDEKAALLATE